MHENIPFLRLAAGRRACGERGVSRHLHAAGPVRQIGAGLVRRDLRAPAAEQLDAGKRTLGQCSITAFLAQDIFGGQVYGILRPGGNYHCYNVVDGHVFDLTSEQFGGEALCYEGNPEQSRQAHFAKEEKYRRYLLLKQRLREVCGAPAAPSEG